MDKNNEDGLEQERPVMTAAGDKEQIDVYKGRVVIRNKGLANSLHIRGTFAPSQIKSIILKPAGTLYNGNVGILANGLKYIVEFKAYQQQDFEEIKTLLAK
jgi:hypothetical protein